MSPCASTYDDIPGVHADVGSPAKRARAAREGYATPRKQGGPLPLSAMDAALLSVQAADQAVIDLQHRLQVRFVLG